MAHAVSTTEGPGPGPDVERGSVLSLGLLSIVVHWGEGATRFSAADQWQHVIRGILARLSATVFPARPRPIWSCPTRPIV
jgi:hypothetical protein